MEADYTNPNDRMWEFLVSQACRGCGLRDLCWARTMACTRTIRTCMDDIIFYRNDVMLPPDTEILWGTEYQGRCIV